MTSHNQARGRFWHRIRHNKTARLPTRFIAVDTETNEYQTDQDQAQHVLKFGCALYWDSPNGKRKHPKREGIVFTRTAEFWDWVDQHTAPRTRTILTAHNLAFDFMVLAGIDSLRVRGWAVEFPLTVGMRFISTAKKGTRTLLLLDSMNFCPTSLADLGQSLGLQKYKMPAAGAPLESWVNYCKRDVEIVELFWRRLLDFLRSNDYGSFGQTAAALALKIYRHAFMQFPIVIHAVPRTLALERAALKGGRNECYQVGQLKRQRYFVLDVNSLYPSVMAAGTFPSLLRFHRRATDLAKLRQLAGQFFLVARVGLDTPEPVYPYTRRHKLLFPVGRFETVLCGPELDHALKMGRVAYCAELAAYDRAPLFRSYAATLYTKRLEYKRQGNAAFALMCKLLLNSLYGKFAQRGHVREEVKAPPGVRFGFDRMYSEKLGTAVNVTYWNGKGIVEYEQGEAFDSFPAIAAAVTAYGRLALWDYMNIAGRENVKYCDTDSLVVTRQGYDNLAAYVDADKLGALKVEQSTMDIVLRGKKDYTFGKVTRTKGLKRTARRVDLNVYDQERFSTMLETIRQGRTSGVTVRTERKRFTRTYDAGVVGLGGTIGPIEVNSF